MLVFLYKFGQIKGFDFLKCENCREYHTAIESMRSCVYALFISAGRAPTTSPLIHVILNGSIRCCGAVWCVA
jgi:hypothetical protein